MRGDVSDSPNGGSVSSGFSLLELILAITIIAIIVSIVLLNFTSFNSRSELRVQSAEIAEFIRFAQERSASTELLDASSSNKEQGFQVVRMKVRDGTLETVVLEKVAGAFTEFSAASGNNFETARAAAPAASPALFNKSEYIVDVCFIDINPSVRRYTRKSLKAGASDCSQTAPTYMLCKDPDPTQLTPADLQRNDFDVHLSVEQPTREVHANVFAVDTSGVPVYGTGTVQPNGTGKPVGLTSKDGTGKRISDDYEGIRVVLMTDNGLKRSIDVYRTGLVSTKADDVAAGCSNVMNVPGGTTPPPAPPGGTPTPAPPGGTPPPAPPPTSCLKSGGTGDCDILLAMKSALEGTGSSLNWDKNVAVHTWDGLTDSGSITGGDVTRLNLSGKGLKGTVPSDLKNLKYLEFLDLSDNQLVGTVPVAISTLRTLKLGSNLLSGPIPAEIGNLPALQNLELQGNNLSGTIPPSLGNLGNLKVLVLSGNSLTGTIPHQLGLLSQLETLALSGNRLTGSIPRQIGDLTRLRNLILSDNELSGSVPSWLSRIASLEYLNLAKNKFTGAIPGELGGLRNLLYLNLGNNLGTNETVNVRSKNKFTAGPIPSNFRNLSSLITLNLFDTSLTGTIPSWIGNLSNLQYLDLRDNDLTGSIPVEIANLTGLRQLRLARNELTGAIPVELGTLVSLEGLQLNWNDLTHAIPTQLGDLSNLKDLQLHRNRLTGPIPTQLGNLPLQQLNLSYNNLSGPLPTQLGNLSQLEYLNVRDDATGGNSLTGSIPSQLGGLTKLKGLWLDNNTFTVCIPQALTSHSNYSSFVVNPQRKPDDRAREVTLSACTATTTTPATLPTPQTCREGAACACPRQTRSWKSGTNVCTAPVSSDPGDVTWGVSLKIYDDYGIGDSVGYCGACWNLRRHHYSQGVLDAGALHIELDAGDGFGRFASLSGGVLAVTANGDDDGGTDRGAVYLFEKSGNAWRRVHKFSDHTTSTNDAVRFTRTRTDVDLNNGDRFGPVSLSGDLLAVGVQFDDDGGTNRGAVYLFGKKNGIWSQVHKFSDHTPSRGGGRFTTEKTDVDLVNNIRFGSAVSLSGNLLAVGARRGGVRARGRIFLFEKQASGKWSQVHEFYGVQSSSPSFTATKTEVGDLNSDNTQMGEAVSLSSNGKMLAVGIARSRKNGNRKGEVRIFEKRSDNTWRQTHKFYDCIPSVGSTTCSTTAQTDIDLIDNAWFGASVSLSGDLLAVGSRSNPAVASTYPGAVYLFEKSGNSWRQAHMFSDDITRESGVGRLTTEATDIDLLSLDSRLTGFGNSVSLSDNRLAVGLVSESSGGESTSLMYIIEPDVGTAVDTTGRTTGTAKFACSSGSWAANPDAGAVCSKLNPCPAAPVRWSEGTNSCSGQLATTTSGSSSVLEVISATYRGSARYACLNGVWQAPTSAKCKEYDNVQIADSTSTTNDIFTVLNISLDAQDNFGSKVSVSDDALSGNMLAVGAMDDDDSGTNTGAVYLFERSGNTWRKTHKFSDHTTSGAAATRFTTAKTDVNLVAGNQFGRSVSLLNTPAGTLLAVGVHNNSTDKGAVYLFERQSDKTWRQTHKFSDHTTLTSAADRFTATDTDVNLVNGNRFGRAVSLSMTFSSVISQGAISFTPSNIQLAVGASRDNEGGQRRGAVFLFEKPAGGKWSQTHKFSDHTASGADATRFTTAKTDINLKNRFNMGEAVALSGNGSILAIGVPRSDEGGDQRGAVYLFERRSDKTWRQIHKFSDCTPPAGSTTCSTTEQTDIDLIDNAWFGASVSFRGNTLMVGANGANSGKPAVYVFKKSGATWSETHRYSDHTASTSIADRFTEKQTDINGLGSSVSLSQDGTIVIGGGTDPPKGTVYICRDSC